MNIQSSEVKPEEVGILIKGLIKVFGRGKGKKVAVNGVHFHVKESECFGLLGPNGKTTTVNMISGMFSQTKGKAYVNGHDISHNMDLIHQSLGLCPQFCVLWESLTPTEHLLFYTRLKGTDLEKERKHVKSILTEVGLSNNVQVNFFQKIIQFFFPKEKKAKELSGGMRRRLSIAISLCGDPKTLILDEPTTGLDPNNRREIWDVIERQKKNRSIILTTHSMEEADALSDRIGIMSHGKLVCLGSSLHLKKRFGNGYVIKIKYKKGSRKGVVGFMNNILSEEKLLILKEFGNSITFEVRSNDERKPFSISKTFEMIDINKEKLGILDFEIQQSTLEDVFLNGLFFFFFLHFQVIKRDEEKIIKSKSKKVSESPEITISENEEFKTQNDLIDEKTSLVSSENKNKYDSSQFSEDAVIDFTGNYTKLLSPSFLVRTRLYFRDCCLQTFFLTWKNFLLSIRRWKESLLQILSPFFIVLLLYILTLVAQLDLSDWYIHPEISDVNINKFQPCQSWGGVNCFIFSYTTNNNVFAETVMNEILQDYELVNDVHYKKFQYEQEMLNFIYHNPNTTQTAISFSNITTYPKPHPQNVTIYTLYFNSTKDLNNQINEFKAIIDNMIYYFSMDSIKETVSKRSINLNEQGFPHPPTRMAVSGQNNIFSTTGPIFFSCISMIVFIISMYQIVLEKEKNLRTGLELIGMKKVSYFLSWFITFICFGILVSLSTMISGYIFVIDVFVYCNPLFMFLLLFTFTFSLINFGFALTPIFNKSKSALIGGFIIIGISFILNLFLANGTLIYLLFNLEEDGYDWICVLFQIFYAPFNFGKMFTDIVNKTAKFYDPTTNTYILNDGYWWAEFVNVNKMSAITGVVEAPASYYSILYLFLNSIIYFSVFMYLDEVIPRPNYSGRSPWFFLKIWDYFKFCKKSNSIENHPKSEIELEEMDNDLKREYSDTRKIDNCSLRVVNAKKNYKTLFRKSVQALKGVDFHCVTGTCLGLLGDNGAGKSTTINIVNGTVGITSGDTIVHNLSVQKEISIVRQNLGICMQDNILWDDLTAKDHVRLFAQFKHLSRKEISNEIKKRLNEVSLYNERNDLVKTFSGGMKRRLCCSLAAVGNPKVLLLDEPTTGLDPFSKREVWKLIREKKKKCSIILTTHSMEEADALSDKIVILRKGRVLCVGDSLHLKSKYNAGFVLKFVSSQGKEEDFKKFMNSHLPHAELGTENAGNFIFSFKTEYKKELIDGLKLVELDLKKGDGERVIKDFGISQETLENIYLKLNRD